MNIQERVERMTPEEINRFIAERVRGWWKQKWYYVDYWASTAENARMWMVDDYDPYHDPTQAMAALLEFNEQHDNVYICWKMLGPAHTLEISVSDGAYYSHQSVPSHRIARVISRAIVAAVMEGDE